MNPRRENPEPHRLEATSATPWARAGQAFREDVWAKGVSGTWLTTVRMLRLLARWPAHRAFRRVIGGPTTRAILDVYPRLAYIHSFSYLFAGSTWAQRLSMATTHWSFLNRTFAASFFDRLIEPSGAVIWRRQCEGHEMSIALLGPCLVSRHHEGDLTFAIAIDATTLCKMAFSIIRADDILADRQAGDRLAVYIGQVQGAAGTRESTRLATTLMNAVAPRDLLLCALAGAAEAWGIDVIYGVPGKRLLSVESWRNSSSRFDYETFWRDHGAEWLHEGHHQLRLPLAEKPLSTIPARHRGRTLAKRRFKQVFVAEMARAVRNALRPLPR